MLIHFISGIRVGRDLVSLCVVGVTSRLGALGVAPFRRVAEWRDNIASYYDGLMCVARCLGVPAAWVRLTICAAG